MLKGAASRSLPGSQPAAVRACDAVPRPLRSPALNTIHLSGLSCVGWQRFQPGATTLVARERLVCCAKKGFGPPRQRGSTPASDDEGGAAAKPRSRRLRRSVPGTVATQEQKDAMGGSQAFQGALAVATQAANKEEDEEFARRLQALKAEGAEKRAALPAGARAASVLPGGEAAAAFDAPAEDLYANPPSLSQTLLSQLNSDVSDPKLKEAKVGPSQLGIAAGAIVLGLVFVLASGVDFAGPSNRFKGVRSAIEPPDSVEAGIIKTRISSLEQQLKLSPGDPEATQALALSYAQLLQYDKAAGLLDKLVATQPNNPDGWRLLGEVSLLGEQSGRAVKAYERAISLRNDDLQIATGMADAYIANGQQAKAVEYLKELRTRVPSTSALGVQAVEAREALKSGGGDAGDVAAAPGGQEAAAAAAGAAESRGGRSRPLRPLEPVSVELLLAKTYSSWRGHDGDAIATYDALIARFPEDFRGYLAKGVFLRDKGRRSDAERMFLQAKFYAPENRQQFIRETAKATPIVDLPDN